MLKLTAPVQTGADSLASIHICGHSKHNQTPIVYPEAIQGIEACVSVVWEVCNVPSYTLHQTEND